MRRAAGSASGGVGQAGVVLDSAVGGTGRLGHRRGAGCEVAGLCGRMRSRGWAWAGWPWPSPSRGGFQDAIGRPVGGDDAGEWCLQGFLLCLHCCLLRWRAGARSAFGVWLAGAGWVPPGAWFGQGSRGAEVRGSTLCYGDGGQGGFLLATLSPGLLVNDGCLVEPKGPPDQLTGRLRSWPGIPGPR
jgi:hypothetical protein